MSTKIKFSDKITNVQHKKICKKKINKINSAYLRVFRSLIQCRPPAIRTCAPLGNLRLLHP